MGSAASHVLGLDTEDVTGDGVLDVALVASSNYYQPPYYLVVLPGLPGGQFGAPVTYALPTTDFPDLAILDIDDDGRNDIALLGSSGIEAWLQRPDGTLQGQGVIYAGVDDYTARIVAHDIDSDGDTDLVVAGYNEFTGVEILTHETGSTFAPSTVSDDRIIGVALGDVDGDGSIDVVATDYEDPFSGRIFVYRNLSAGWSRVVHDSDAIYLGSIETGDVTGDGRTDVVATRGPHPRQACRLRTRGRWNACGTG